MIPDVMEFIRSFAEEIRGTEPLHSVPYLIGAAAFCAAWALWVSYWSGWAAEQTRERVRGMLNIKKPPSGPINRVRREVNQLWLAEELEKRLAKANISVPAADVLLALMAVTAVFAVLLSRAMVISYWAALPLAAIIVAVVTVFVLKQRGANLADSVNKQLPEAARVLANRAAGRPFSLSGIQCNGPRTAGPFGTLHAAGCPRDSIGRFC